MEMKQEPQLSFLLRVQQRINELLQSDIEWAEIVSILGAFIWGAVLLIPYDTFATSKAYNIISFWPDWSWGIFFCFFCLAQGSAVLFNSIIWRLRFSGAGAIIWATICSMLVLSNPISTAYFYLIPTLGSVWAFARLFRYKV